ncbi:50S ribosome-binding GTPase [bacterium]|nr:50S ribosome-binding GTPase [candidate division CSSED10-310 bacterium]
MPANLTPQYKSAEARYKSAQSIQEKIDALEEMYRTIPKHKGTEKLCADIKQRLSKARQQQEQAGRSTKKGVSFHVPREGAAQITLAGLPNSGKSSIVSGFTNAAATVADYPFTTQRPLPGMLSWENVQFQLIDLPALSRDFFEPYIPSLIRVSDMVMVVVDLENIEGFEVVHDILLDNKIELVPSFKDADYHSRIVRIPAIVCATKKDCPDSAISLELLREVSGNLEVLTIESRNPADAHRLGRTIFEHLDLVRVYTKAPGKEANMNTPIVIRKGSTLMDVTSEIHKDFSEDMKYARVWGSGKFDGQRIQRDYIIEEGDIFEFKV